MESFWQDVHYGLRSLRKNPGFTTVAVLTLALGIGANSAIFSVVNAVLLRQLPFSEPGRLVYMMSQRHDKDGPFSVPDYIDYRDLNRSLEEVSAIATLSANLTGRGQPERLQGVRVSGNLFHMLGLNAAAGRLLELEDDIPGRPRVAVISYGLWQRRFGGDPSLIGQTLELNGSGHLLVGVLPQQFLLPTRDIDVAIPLVPDSDPWRNNRGSVNFLRFVGRLKQGITLQQAQTELSTLAQHLKQLYPESNAQKLGVVLTPLGDQIIGDYRKALCILLGAVGTVLLIACSNLANLWMVRASARQREMAIRTALGASRTRLINQMLVESCLVAALGGMLGFFLAAVGVRVLAAVIPADLPHIGAINVDAIVLAFTACISLLAGLAFGLTPALQLSRTNLNETLREGSRGAGEGQRRSRSRNMLVASEFALSLVLLAGAGLFLKSFVRVASVNPGFSSGHLLAVRLSLPKHRYVKREAIGSFVDQLMPRLQTLPGVESVGVTSALPLSGVWGAVDFRVMGRPLEPRERVPAAQYRAVSPDYLRTMGVPLLAGRGFNEYDKSQSARVALINEEFARRFWPEGNPLGGHLQIDDVNDGWSEIEIVGVAGNVKHFGLDAAPTFDIYIPFHQAPQDAAIWLSNNQFWLLRTRTDPMSLAGAVRRELRGVDADVATTSARTMEQYLATSIAPRRFNLFLLGVFAVAAVLLAAAGIFGVISYSVSRRTHEIGIRMALGAQPGTVFRLIVGEALRVAGFGIAVGLAAALALTRVLTGLLFGVSATDPAVFACVAAALGGVALLAASLPARRATRVDAIVALRYE
jgi:predicted permease